MADLGRQKLHHQPERARRLAGGGQGEQAVAGIAMRQHPAFDAYERVAHPRFAHCRAGARCLGQVEKLVEGRAQSLGRADARALVLQGGARDRPAFSPPPDDPVRGGPDVVEEDFAEAGLSGDLTDGSAGHAGLIQVDQEIGDGFVLGRVRFGADQREHMGGLGALRRPGLLSGDHPVVADSLAPAPDRSQVRACPRLGIALAPDVIPPHGGRDEAVLLLRRSAFEERGDQQGHAVPADLHGRAGAAERLSDDLGLDDVDRPLRPAVAARHAAVEVAGLRGLGPECGDLGRPFRAPGVIRPPSLR